MALRKLAGPFEHKDWEGYYLHECAPLFWVDELDGFLARQTLSPLAGYTGSILTFGILQLNGVFTKRTTTYSYNADGGYMYDLASRQLARYKGSYVASPVGRILTIKKGVDWATLSLPYNPEIVNVTYAAVPGYELSDYIVALLPDRVLVLGRSTSGAYTEKIFGVPYGNSPSTQPVAECTLGTIRVPGTTTKETWYSSGGMYLPMFIPSATPERSVFLVRPPGTVNDVRAIEYDYLKKAVVGRVRRLGDKVDGMLPAPTPPVGGVIIPRLAGFSSKLKLWYVNETAAYPYSVEQSEEAPFYPGTSGVGYRNRLWLFSDIPLPATLSNPVAITPSNAGEVVRYQVRLLGADYEPCAGHKVNWSSFGLGVVQILQSETDENGYAETSVAYPPRWDGPWEGATITAEVTF